MGDSFLNQMRSTLLERATTLGVRDEAITRHLRGEDGRLEADFADRVAFTEMDEVLEQLDVSARTELEAIRIALVRIDEGRYQTCARCEGDIPRRRLEIVPTTTVCVACAD